MTATDQLDVPVQVELRRDGRIWQTLQARQASDLRIRVEMMTGVGWLELQPLYAHMLTCGEQEVRSQERVCHSYEKWGDWQQEVVEIKVRMSKL